MPRKLSSETLTDAQLEELVAMGLTDSELSNLLGISESTFKARYLSVIKRGRARLRKSLRRAQIRSALSGNSTMLVWLGKQYLGRSRSSRPQRKRGSQGNQHYPQRVRAIAYQLSTHDGAVAYTWRLCPLPQKRPPPTLAVRGVA